jgi:dTDP-4-amino-4,6-dideoxygalactose transaminase
MSRSAENAFIPYNKAVSLPESVEAVTAAARSQLISGNQEWTKKCEAALTDIFKAPVLLTSSCTSALEMCALLLELAPGDEVIVPDFTFVSTANAFARQGATVVFADIDPNTLNLSAASVKKNLSDKTKAIVLVHYAGMPCDFAAFQEFKDQGLKIIEDAAHCIGATHQGRPLGTFGDFATFSFHETKNITCGEGGALVINNPAYVRKAEIIREKGTNRSEFFRGKVNKYQWKDLGSNYLVSELQAAYLYPQIVQLTKITERRRQIFQRYYQEIKNLGSELLTLPHIDPHTHFNAHIFHLKLPSMGLRQSFIKHMKEQNILCVFHYQPLHRSDAGLRFGRYAEEPINSITVSETMVRLPLYYDLSDAEQMRVIAALKDCVSQQSCNSTLPKAS